MLDQIEIINVFWAKCIYWKTIHCTQWLVSCCLLIFFFYLFLLLSLSLFYSCYKRGTVKSVFTSLSFSYSCYQRGIVKSIFTLTFLSLKLSLSLSQSLDPFITISLCCFINTLSFVFIRCIYFRRFILTVILCRSNTPLFSFPLDFIRIRAIVGYA